MAAPRVKICGLRDAHIAKSAAFAGADFLGFNFVNGVRRQLSPAAGASIIEAYYNMLSEDSLPGPPLVGLFRDQPIEWVNRVSHMAHLDIVQLCGDEDDEYCAQVEKPILRQVRVRPETAKESLRAAVRSHLDAGRMVLLDAYDPSTPGGTGKTFEWAVAEGIASEERVLLAGGLTPDNVAEAVALLRPWGVDVSSGVEVDGQKDEEKIEEFIRAALG
ncbi:MAG: phosphoribosylanthranilate isomerase [Chloroflexota bacterium]